MSYFALSAQKGRWFFVLACVFGEGGDGEAEDNVTFDLSGMGSPIKRAYLDRSGPMWLLTSPAWVVPLKARTSTVPVRHTLFRLIAWYRMES